MRICEFDEPEGASIDNPANESIANLITVLNVVLSRAEEEATEASISTPALINMVKNTGIQYDYQALVQAYEGSQAVQNLIKNYSKDTVDLASKEDDSLDDIPQGGGEDAEAAIGRIAKRVAKRNVGKDSL